MNPVGGSIIDPILHCNLDHLKRLTLFSHSLLAIISSLALTSKLLGGDWHAHSEGLVCTQTCTEITKLVLIGTSCYFSVSSVREHFYSEIGVHIQIRTVTTKSVNYNWPARLYMGVFVPILRDHGNTCMKRNQIDTTSWLKCSFMDLDYSPHLYTRQKGSCWGSWCQRNCRHFPFLDPCTKQ